MKFTNLEQQIIDTLKEILQETECVYSHDLVKDNPTALRGALSSLVAKGVLDIDKCFPSKINGVDYYEVFWNEDLIA
jgi:hypothetical protein